MLTFGYPLKISNKNEALIIELPKMVPCDYAIEFKITIE
jgi:hypothetical protein